MDYLIRNISDEDWKTFKKKLGVTSSSKGEIAKLLRQFIKQIAIGDLIIEKTFWRNYTIKSK
jgi:hypothetical protein